MLRLSGALLVMAMVCALTLAVIYRITAPVIEEQRQLLLERSLKSVLKAQSYHKKKQEDNTYYEAQDEKGNVIGWCLPLTAQGYGGQLQILAGTNTDGKLTGVMILEHKETPGLGSKINELGYKQTEPAFLKQFKGKKIQDIVLVKSQTNTNIQAITGATVSSKAVTDGVRKEVEEFLKKRK